MQQEYEGINVAKNMVVAMAISGALAGLAGTEQILGLHNRFIQRFSPDLGFMGIAVALLGKNHPVGVILPLYCWGSADWIGCHGSIDVCSKRAYYHYSSP